MTIRIIAATLLLASLAFVETADAQLLGTTVTYTFRVPITKVLPNPCSTTSELISGTLDFTIRTIDSGLNGFAIVTDVTSTGIAQDALTSGILIVDGTQKPAYSYAYTSGFSASFAKRPAHFRGQPWLLDFLTRGPAYPTDPFVMKTQFDVTFINGVPIAPVIKDLTVICP